MRFVGGFPQLGDLIAELGSGHTAGPAVFVQLCMRVTTDQPIFNLHGFVVLSMVLAVLMRQSPTA
jgi:hypothetical protein